MTASATPKTGVASRVYVIGALGGALYGYDTGIVAGAILFIQPDLHLSSWEKGWVVSVLLLGALVAAGVAGRLSDRFGRRPLLMTASILFFFGAIGSALAPSVPVLLVSRVILGLGTGVASVTVPTYLSEVSPTAIRGRVTSMFQLMISGGILLAYLVNLCLSPFGAWRWMLLLGVIPAVALFVGMLWLRETPRWLAIHGRTEEALEQLAARGETDPQALIDQMITRAHSQGNDRPWRKIFSRAWIGALGVGVLLAIFQQLMGTNAVAYYGPTILTEAGFGNGAALVNNVGFEVVAVLCIIVAANLVDRIGRRRMLVWTAIIMAIGMVALGLVFAVGNLDLLSVKSVAVVSMFVFKIAFNLGWGPLVWVVLPELFPNELRGAAVGVATLTNWAANFVVSLLFPVLLTAMPWGVFFIFAACCLLAMALIAWLLRETTGRSLEQLTAEHELGGAVD